MAILKNRKNRRGCPETGRSIIRSLRSDLVIQHLEMSPENEPSFPRVLLWPTLLRVPVILEELMYNFIKLVLN